jgi:hypothetical protein
MPEAATAEDEGEELTLNLADLEKEAQEGTLSEEEKQQRAPQPGKPAPVPGPSSAKPAAAAQDGLKDLERQIENERRARATTAQENARLQTERDNAIRFAREAEARGMTTYELYTENQITAATEQMDALTSQQETAYADGDFKTVADINKRLNKLGGQLAILERDKATLAEQREQMKQQHARPTTTRQPAQPAQLPANPLERAIMNRTEPTKAFLRKHPELVRNDGSLKRTAIDAHDRALDEGHTVDTQSYFDYIEGILGTGTAPAGDGDGAAPRPGRAPSTAAPVSRGGGPERGGPGLPNSDGTISVTPRMRRLAEEQGVPIKEWVTNYVRLLKEGRVTPIA